MKKSNHDHDYKAIFGYAKAADFDGYNWPADIKEAMDKLIDEHYAPYTDERLEGWLLKKFKAAAEEQSLGKRADLIRAAVDAAFLQYRDYLPREDVKPMPDDVKAMLRELNESKRADKPATTKEQKAKKVPVFNDPDKQMELCKKYPQTVPGSFVQDPHKPGGTLVSIKCECGKTREIHLSDLFQVRKCHDCKKLGK